MEEQLSQCFESLGKGEYFSQIESCQPFKDVYSLNDGSLLLVGMIGLITGVALTMILQVIVSFILEN